MIDPDTVTKEWTKDGIHFCIARCRDHYCGYCTFPKRLVREQGYSGFLVYVPIHGGITYARAETDGRMTYGFDCAHAGDDENPDCQDEKWLSTEAERMAEAIQLAVAFEPTYLLGATNEEKAAAIDAYHRQCIEHNIVFVLGGNFSAMINVLFGNL